MNVGKLSDAKAFEGFGQARQPDALTNDFHVQATVKQPIATEALGTRCDLLRTVRSDDAYAETIALLRPLGDIDKIVPAYSAVLPSLV